jgi:hypothetical protein
MAFRLSPWRRHPGVVHDFRGSIPGPHVPLSTLYLQASRPAAHDSGPVWLATPSPYDSFIRYTSPVLTAHGDCPGVFGPPQPYGSADGPASAHRVGLRERLGQQDRGQEASTDLADGGEMAQAFRPRSARWAARRASSWDPAQDQRRADRGCRGSDLGEHAAGSHPLEHAEPGPKDGAEPDDDQPCLARLRTAAASKPVVQALARPAVDREGT